MLTNDGRQLFCDAFDIDKFRRAAPSSAAAERDWSVFGAGVHSSFAADLRFGALAPSERFSRNLQTLRYRRSGHRDKQSDRRFNTLCHCLALASNATFGERSSLSLRRNLLRRAFHNLCNSIDDVLGGKRCENDAENPTDDVGASKPEQLCDTASG